MTKLPPKGPTSISTCESGGEVDMHPQQEHAQLTPGQAGVPEHQEPLEAFFKP